MDLFPGRKKRIQRPGSRIFSKGFEKYVKNDEDVIGLIAYSFYKKAKVDWLRAFHERTGENPTEARIHEWTLENLADGPIQDHRTKAFRLIEEYRKQEVVKASLLQVESTSAKVDRISVLAYSTHSEVKSLHSKVTCLTGNKGFWANIGTSQVSFICTTALAGLVYIGLHIGGLEPLKWFSEKAPRNTEVRPGNSK